MDGQGTLLPLDEGAKRAVDLILAVRAASGKVMLIGNGGSAAIASHMQNDLCKAADVRALVFNEPTLLTALSNDDGYGSVFERPVELWATPGDLLLAISSSGRSENILRAVRKAAAAGCEVITLSGFGADNALRGMGTINFYVPSRVYGYVEVIHSALAHFLADCAMTARVDARKPGG
ncbi:MAG: SIS domain-containing protein [Acidobacteria bacterium]|nr:SIS domain-containing protein [Acidobacteriota bacterium]